ncbi:MAG: alkaline phosphatase family protein [Halobacteriales archaeon]
MTPENRRRELLASGPDGYVYPDYGGYSFHRVVPTLLDLLGGDVATDRTLPNDVLRPIERDVNRVLLLFVDGFGDAVWRRHVDDPLVSAFETAGHLTPLTSIYPSETAAAVTSHHTGLTAGEHGAIGWDQWVPDADSVVQTLPFTAGDRPADEAGAKPADLFVGDPLYPSAGIDAALVQPSESVDSTYTRRATAGMGRRGYEEIDEFARVARDAVAGADGPTLIDAYLPHVDAAAHSAGTESDAFALAVASVSRGVRDLLDGLDRTSAERTLVVLTADHGLLDTEPATNVDLRTVDGVWDHLRRRNGDRIPPVGSGRNVHLFLEPGSVPAVREAIENRVAALTFTREEALDAGLFGPAAGERIRERCGDLVIVPRSKTVWHDPEKLEYVGMHGGLAPEEMLVPFAVARASALVSA